MTRRFHLSVEYTNGKFDMISFRTLDCLYIWLQREGDHVLDYDIFTS